MHFSPFSALTQSSLCWNLGGARARTRPLGPTLWADDARKGSNIFYWVHSPVTYLEYELWPARNCATSPKRASVRIPLDNADAVQAEAQRVSKCARHMQDLLLVISLYKDGSHGNPDGQRRLPTLAG